MRIAAVVVLLAACSKSGDGGGGGGGEVAPAATGKARPAITDPLGFCERDRLALVRRQTCFPEDASLKMAIDDLDRRVRVAPAEFGKRRAVGAQCAIDLHGIMRAEQPALCPLDMTDGEKTELAAFLSAWFGERTVAPAGDAVLAQLATDRDAICACKKMDCVRPLLAALSAPDGSIPGAHMVDEANRCKQNLLLP